MEWMGLMRKKNDKRILNVDSLASISDGLTISRSNSDILIRSENDLAHFGYGWVGQMS
jgi:hypothetical protein